MKKRFFALISVFLFIVSSFSLASCGERENTILTNTRFVVYENAETAKKTDMISFYVTSDVKPFGVWEYDVSGLKSLAVFHETEETNDYGTFFDGGVASYKTLILKPVAEGEDTVTFSLENGRKDVYNVSVKKDENGIFRIKAELISEENSEMISKKSASAVSENSEDNSDKALYIIIITAVIAVVALGGYFILKGKK